MAIDSAVDSTALNLKFTNIANAIRAKNGENALYSPEGMVSAIEALETGSKVQEKRGTFTLGAYQSGYFQAASIMLDFEPDEFTMFFDNDFYTNGSTSYLNCATANFRENSRFHGFIVSNKFSSKVYLEVLISKVSYGVYVNLLKRSGSSEGTTSGISTSTKFSYVATKYT